MSNLAIKLSTFGMIAIIAVGGSLNSKASQNTSLSPINVSVAVWDSYFDAKSQSGLAQYFDGIRNGALRETYFWDERTRMADANAPAESTGLESHGFKTSFVIADGPRSL